MPNLKSHFQRVPLKAVRKIVEQHLQREEPEDDDRSEGDTEMSDGELKFPKWQIPLQELILEFDHEKLPAKVEKVEALLFERMQQLGQEPDGRVELDALKDALTVLRIIKADKLDFPDWK
jgi:hypothetical protein